MDNGSRRASINGTKFLTFSFILIISCIYDSYLNNSLRDTPKNEGLLDIQKIEQEINEKMLFQEEAIKALIMGLKDFNNSNNVMIISLIGPTGVGKTFLTNILKKHAYSFTEINFKLDSKITELSPLLIIDNLTVDDLDELVGVLTNNKERILFIPIFNIQESKDNLEQNINFESIKVINDTLQKTELPFRTAIFHQFNKTHAETWLHKTFKNRRLNSEKIDCLMKSLLDEANVENYGFKRLNPKFSVMGC